MRCHLTIIVPWAQTFRHRKLVQFSTNRSNCRLQIAGNQWKSTRGIVLALYEERIANPNNSYQTQNYVVLADSHSTCQNNSSSASQNWFSRASHEWISICRHIFKRKKVWEPSDDIAEIEDAVCHVISLAVHRRLLTGMGVEWYRTLQQQQFRCSRLIKLADGQMAEVTYYVNFTPSFGH